MSERLREGMSAKECANKESSAEQTNEQTDSGFLLVLDHIQLVRTRRLGFKPRDFFVFFNNFFLYLKLCPLSK